jgi:aspartate-semialdehyde dehydrogenase
LRYLNRSPACKGPGLFYRSKEIEVMKDRVVTIVGVTCVRMPVLRAHCAAITFECENAITDQEARAILSKAPGVRIVDDRQKNHIPMPIDASGQDDVQVGRIRKDLSDAGGHSISTFAAADQLSKGAALNAIQIADAASARDGLSRTRSSGLNSQSVDGRPRSP